MRILENLEPKQLFYYFEEISRIPRGSGNEKAISDYMVQFANELGLEVKQDEAYNIYIKKPASKGYEHLSPVILQGHLDMVCDKNNDTEHDFTTEGLKLYIDGDFIRAKGTTLGADNGVAIAYQMAILADNTLSHPPIEVLMTTEEETGMGGVAAMHPEYLEGRTLINLDTDNEGEFLVSCAGGSKAEISLPIQREQVKATNACYEITIKGLNGGHSGADIHLQRGNANILMNRLLSGLKNELGLGIASLEGGSKDNVITREAVATIVIDEANKAALVSAVEVWEKLFKAEYAVQDAGVEILLNPVQDVEMVCTADSTERILDLIMMLPQGVMTQSTQIEGLVESSLNTGVVKLEESTLKLGISIRSSVASRKEWIKTKIVACAKSIGANYTLAGDYPAWEYAVNSPLRDQAIETFKAFYGKEPKIEAIHAGLECGFISEKLQGVDIIAFGPNAYDIHSPEERVSITSMSRVYDFLTQLLSDLKK